MTVSTDLPTVERFTRFTDEHRQNAIQLAANELPRYYKISPPENHPALKLLSSWWNQNNISHLN